MMKKHLYFPVALEDAIAVLRHQCQFDKATGVAPNSRVIAYTDRTLAVDLMKEATSSDQRREICLLVVELDERTMGHLLMGDHVHHGPCVNWIADQILELDHSGQSWILHAGHFSLELAHY